MKCPIDTCSEERFVQHYGDGGSEPPAPYCKAHDDLLDFEYSHCSVCDKVCVADGSLIAVQCADHGGVDFVPRTQEPTSDPAAHYESYQLSRTCGIRGCEEYRAAQGMFCDKHRTIGAQELALEFQRMTPDAVRRIQKERDT